MTILRFTLPLLLTSLATAACGGDDGGAVSSDEDARRAYFGLDASIGQSLTLGFAGFNAATSANIEAQTAMGIVGGSLTVTGQVDRGSSANKGMRLQVGMVDYTDGKLVIDDTEIDVNITYSTNVDPTLQPALTLSLKNIPTGTLTGTLLGDYHMTGDLAADATVNLMFAGTIQDDGTGKVIRAPNTTHVTGTVTSGDGIYDVDVML